MQQLYAMRFACSGGGPDLRHVRKSCTFDKFCFWRATARKRSCPQLYALPIKHRRSDHANETLSQVWYMCLCSSPALTSPRSREARQMATTICAKRLLKVRDVLRGPRAQVPTQRASQTFHECSQKRSHGQGLAWLSHSRRATRCAASSTLQLPRHVPRRCTRKSFVSN